MRDCWRDVSKLCCGGKVGRCINSSRICEGPGDVLLSSLEVMGEHLLLVGNQANCSAQVLALYCEAVQLALQRGIGIGRRRGPVTE